MKPDAKMSDQDFDHNVFEFRPISPLIWSKKHDLKYIHMGYASLRNKPNGTRKNISRSIGSAK